MFRLYLPAVIVVHMCLCVMVQYIYYKKSLMKSAHHKNQLGMSEIESSYSPRILGKMHWGPSINKWHHNAEHFAATML